MTFKKTDPLFVLDLSTPSAPKVLGDLKIPGFSTYLHRIDQNHLLSIGFDADDRGNFAYFNGLLLQLFDVTKPTEPKLLHREKIGTRGSGSEAATDHLAFNFLAKEGLLAIPTAICEGGGNGRAGNQLTFAGCWSTTSASRTVFGVSAESITEKPVHVATRGGHNRRHPLNVVYFLTIRFGASRWTKPKCKSLRRLGTNGRICA